MKIKTAWQTLKQPHSLVFLLVVLAAYLGALATYEGPLPLPRLLLLVLLGIIYLAIGIFAIDAVVSLHPPAGSYLYFAVQLLIAAAIIYLAQFNAWAVLLPLASQTVFIFSRRGILIANLVILVFFLFLLSLVGADPRNLFQSGVTFATAIFFVVVFTQTMLNEQKARAEIERLAHELGEANRQLREYAAQVESLAAAHERNRLAREIHDGLGHYLTAINIQIKAAGAVLESDAARAHSSLEKAQTLAQDALDDVRRSVAALRGEPALDRPLPDALRLLVDEIRSAGLVADFTVQGRPRPLPPPVELTLYRTVQEGLTNVRRHALASRVEVSLNYRTNEVKLTLQDNGVGLTPEALDPAGPQAGFGLFGLRERATLLGGSLEIETASGHGFRLEISLPVEAGVETAVEAIG